METTNFSRRNRRRSISATAIILLCSILSWMPLNISAATHNVSTSAELTTALTNSISGDIIRLTANIDYDSKISVSDKKITFDLNGKKLNVVIVTGSGDGFSVNNGEVKLKDPANGEFNVTAPGGISTWNGGKAEATSVKATGGTLNCWAIYCPVVATVGNNEVTVYGDVTINNSTSTNNYAIQAGMSKVTVHGNINVTVVQRNNYGVYADQNSTVTILGNINVTATGSGATRSYGVYADRVSTVAVHGNITINGSNGSDNDPNCGVSARDASTVDVYGDITVNCSVNNTSSLHYGVYANLSTINVQGNLAVTGSRNICGAHSIYSGKVTIDGALSVPSGAIYVRVGTSDRGWDEYDKTSSSKPGYLQYTGSNISVVWVKKPAGAPEISGPTKMSLTEGYASTSTSEYTVTGDPTPTVSLSSYEPEITWNDITKKLDIAAGLTAGIYPIEITASNGKIPGATIEFTLTVNPTPVCEIVGGSQYTSITDAIAAVPSGGTATIRLIKNINHVGLVDINGKNITLDLDGKNLNVENTSERALSVRNSGQIKLKKPTDGEFNVTGIKFGAWIQEGIAEITNVTATGNIDNDGVYCQGANAEVTVFGNVTVRVGNSSNHGIHAVYGGKVTVNGIIEVFNEAVYIYVGSTNKSKNQHENVSTKEGYLEYIDGTSKVWVKAMHICEVGTAKYSATIDAALAHLHKNSAGTGTIKMLTNYTYREDDYLYISSDYLSDVTIDLNGKILTINNGPSDETALVVSGGGASAPVYFRITDSSGGGELNAVGDHGAYATSYAEATVTNAVGTLVEAAQAASYGKLTVTGNATGSSTGVWATNNGTVNVLGNVVADLGQDASDWGYPATGVHATLGGVVYVGGDVTAINRYGEEDAVGVTVQNGGKVTIDGKINVPSGATYIWLGSKAVTKESGVADPSKPGYLIYTDGTSTVWVKDDGSHVGITTVSNTDTAAIIGYCDTMGRKLQTEPTKGLYIILYDNGTAKKVVK